jgi:Mrp family chromosome partitioning ATPase
VRVHRLAAGDDRDALLFMLDASESLAAAAFRVLRHRLAGRGEVRTILVTSPDAAEGKTLCATNLALALAEGGRSRVLLLEANFDRPAVGGLLRFDPPVGFAEQLEQRGSRGWVAVENVSPGLHTLAIDPRTQTHPLVDVPALSQAISQARAAGYDYVVIDGPAVLGSADANLLEECVEGIVMVVRAGSTRAHALREAVEQLGDGKLVGIALLGT